MNASWYFNPLYFSTAGVQNCGVQGINSAGQMVYVDAPLVINPAGTPPGGGTQSPPPIVEYDQCSHLRPASNGEASDPPGPGTSSDGDG